MVVDGWGEIAYRICGIEAVILLSHILIVEDIDRRLTLFLGRFCWIFRLLRNKDEWLRLREAEVCLTWRRLQYMVLWHINILGAKP